MYDSDSEDDFFNLLDLVDEFTRRNQQGNNRYYDLEEIEAIADYFFDTGKLKKALQVLDLGLQQHPGAESLELKKVNFLTALNRTREADRILNRLEDQSLNYYELHLARAGLYSKIGKHYLAVQQYRKAIPYAEFPEDVYHLLALEYQVIGSLDQAIKYLKLSLKHLPDDEIALYNLALCYDLADENEAAREFFKSFVDENPYSEVGWYQLGILEAKLENHDEAIQALEYATLIDEFFSAAYYERARLLERQYRYEEAIKAYQATFDFEGPTAYAYFKIGTCQLRLHRPRKAEKFFAQAIAEDPEMEEAFYELALIYDENEKWPQAIYHINKALQLDPENFEFRHVCAQIHRRAGRLDEASVIYQKLIQNNHAEGRTYTELASVQFDLCEFDAGMNTLYKGLERLPDSAEIHYHLAGYLFTIKESDEAFIYLKKAIKLQPEGKFFFLKLFPRLSDDPKFKQILSL